MIKKNVTPKEAIGLLNEMLKIDRIVTESLFNTRIACNKKLANHSSIQVTQITKNFCLVGLLGVLNGMFGIDKDGWGCICMDLTEYNKIERFRLITEKDKPKKGGNKE